MNVSRNFSGYGLGGACLTIPQNFTRIEQHEGDLPEKTVVWVIVATHGTETTGREVFIYFIYLFKQDSILHNRHPRRGYQPTSPHTPHDTGLSIV